MPDGSQWSQYILNCWPSCLALLVLFGFQAIKIKSRMFETGHSGWWAVPLVLTMIGLAACPPSLDKVLYKVKVVLLWAFIVPQLPLFIDKRKPCPPENGSGESHATCGETPEL
jgi:uncharacterized membrane protein YhaH (DUF805 family)